MSRIIYTLAVLFTFLVAKSQPYGNEWINYSQKYYYFPIANEGVYRIDYNTLLSAGIPIASIDPRNIQVFGRGAEIPIYVEGENDGVFGTSDFIELYAQPNDGFYDARVYDFPESQSNPYYSLFNDTILYYVTWNTSISNVRMKLETSINFGSFTKASYILKELINVEKSTYHRGKTIGSNTDPQFVESEGFFSAAFGFNSNAIKSFKTTNIYNGGPAALFKTIFVGASNNTANPDHRIKLEYFNNSNAYVQIADTIFEGYKQIRFQTNITSSALNPTKTDVRYSSISYQNINDNRTAIAYSYLKYPHTLALESDSTYNFVLADDPQGKTYIELTNFLNKGITRLYDVTNGKRITVVASGTLHRALVPNTGNEKQCYLTSEGRIRQITQLNAVSATGQFDNYASKNADYLIITNNKLWTGATEYANYRASTGYNVLVADIDQLYHQFAVGIVKHPLSIRNFADYALDTWTTKPEHLFLIGKSIYLDYTRNAANYAKSLVPSFGLPPCDALLTAGLNGTQFEMAIPTGRLAAKSNEEILDYLNKMAEYETEIIPSPEWKKNIIHFGGGKNLTEQETMLGYLDSYKKIIEDTLIGARVSTFLKTSSDPVQITISDSVKKLMDNGTSLLTFFAHASASTFDISLEDPSFYNNKGKYPILFANACLSGDIHNPSNNSTSENFVLIPDKGVIGFVATVGAGYPPYLDLYEKEIYKNIAYKYYGQSIGKIMKEATKVIQNPPNVYTKDVVLETTLHGDPAIRFNSSPLPDIMVSQPNVFYTPSDITTDIDSFSVNVILTNLGKTTRDSFNVLVTRVLPTGIVDSVFTWVNGLKYKDTVIASFKINSIQEAGLNQFNISADFSALITEMTEVNNTTTVFQNIKTNDIIPVYPYQFAIVPSQNVILKASTGDPFALARNYIFEVDTTDLFNSPIKEQGVVNHSGGVVSWSPNLLSNMKDSLVYFWRVSPQPQVGSQNVWRESSFQYIKDKSGWAQAHFFQYKNDKYNLVLYDKIKRKFEFESAVKELSCLTMGNGSWNASNETDGSIGYKLDAGYQDSYGCAGIPSLVIAVIDSITLEPWGNRWVDNNSGVMYNPDNHFGNFNDLGSCRNWRVEKYFLFHYNKAGIDAATDMLTNRIPKGNYVLVYNYRYSNCQYWDLYNTGLHNIMESMGANGLRALPDDYPFIFMTKVGYPGTTVQKYGTLSTDIITLETTINNSFPNGNVYSDLIGPSTYWRSLHWRSSSLESPSFDDVNIKLSGVKLDGNITQLGSFPMDSLDILNLYDYVDANNYPYIKLEAKLRDDTAQTAPQMKRWQVIYDDVPEAALDASKGFEYNSEKISEGDSVQFKIGISNISNLDMDSIMVKHWIEDEQRNIIPLYYGKRGVLLSNESITTDIKFGSKGYSGINKFWVEINPKDSLWQIEKYHFNNIAQLTLNIERDKINPLLDVTFDGVHVLDGDIVSAKPFIQVKLTDENRFIALNDTSNFALFLTDPSGKVSRVHFVENNTEVMRFVPAVLPKNSCSIEFNPVFTTDGRYELRVQAKDASANSSGIYDYVINFEVINKSSITEVINYPNPFTSSTRFVFTLTGSEIPSNFKIQILTITGKVVKEIFLDEIGPIRIGRNITDYAWDGKDQFGDPLANGVYLYRVVTMISDKEIERRESNADQYFHNGFGKMYLMR